MTSGYGPSVPEQAAISVVLGGEEPLLVELAASAVASIQLVTKHPLAIRWMHRINFPILFTII
ncbi:MAG: hypothetical protein ABI164_11070 [Acidobacteriaceae bacterium]